MANLQISLAKLSLKGVEETDVEIGRGAYGVVRECNYNNQRYAGKIVHQLLRSADSEEYTALAEKFESECENLSKLYHPNIVYFVGVYFKQGEEFPSLLMELLPMSLHGALTKYSNLPTYMKNIILLDVACGLSYLHSQNEPLVHRDLTSKNVLLTDNFHAKIADFGVARILPFEQLEQVLKLTKTPGTVLFMPPETFSDDPVYDISLDMFSYGVLILNTVNQTWPKAKDRVADGRSILTEVQRRKEDLDAMGKDHSLKGFVLQCLQDCKLRPTVSAAVEELTKAVCSTPMPYSNTFEMLVAMDSLRAETNQLVSEKCFLKEERDELKQENDRLFQQKNALESRMKHQANEIQLTKRMLRMKEKEIERVNEEVSMNAEMACETSGQMKTLEMQIAALQSMPSNKMQLLDPTVALKWEKCDPLPYPRKHVQAVELDGKLYVGSGYGASNDIASVLYRFNLETENWMDCPQSLTLQFAMVVFDGKILLIGGKMKIPNGEAGKVQAEDEIRVAVELSASNKVQATGKIQYLSQADNEWKFYSDDEMPSMPTARMGAVATSLGFHLIVAGGYNAFNSRIRVVEIYDKCSNAWYSGANLPVDGAEFKTALSHGDQWYLLGGSNQYKYVVTTSLKKLIKKAVVLLAPDHSERADIQEHEASANENVWTTMTNLSREFSCTAYFGGNLVVFGGEKTLLSTSFYDSIYVYDTHRQIWIYVADMPCQLSKCTAVTLSSGVLLLMGGHSKLNKPEDVVYKCSLVPAKDMTEEEHEV